MKRLVEKKCFQRNPSWTENSPHCQHLFFKKWPNFPVVGGSSSCFLSCVLQCVPGGGGGGTSTQSAGDSRNPTLLPSSHSLPECHAAELAVLLHRAVPGGGHPLATAVHRGRQQDLQRLLERPSAAPEKLQHLLPGRQHRQRGGCFRHSLL